MFNHPNLFHQILFNWITRLATLLLTDISEKTHWVKWFQMRSVGNNQQTINIGLVSIYLHGTKSLKFLITWGIFHFYCAFFWMMLHFFPTYHFLFFSSDTVSVGHFGPRNCNVMLCALKWLGLLCTSDHFGMHFVDHVWNLLIEGFSHKSWICSPFLVFFWVR